MSARDASGQDRRISRGRFIGIGGMSAAALALGVGELTSGRAVAQPAFSGYPFALGVASGDPEPDGVVLWTRLCTSPTATDGWGGIPRDQSYTVRYEVARDENFGRIVQRGEAEASPALGHSVHPEVGDLSPGREYYYRFEVGGEISPVGRTKTAPAPGAKLERMAFAFASCQAWTGGRYAAYRHMAADDLDLVFHLGDYIYEGGATRSLTDFRVLHARYKTSPDLQAAHRAFPFVCVFDDHEVDNNWVDEVPQYNTPNFMELRANAFQAYYEHLPLRHSSMPVGPDMLLYRRLAYGRLAEFSVLDTRQYRSDQVQGAFIAPRDPDSFDPALTMTGSEQERWLLDGLASSKARWNVLAQQTIMAQYDYDTTSEGVSINHDQWDGYVAARGRILDFVRERRPSNPVVLSGDWHSNWVNDLKTDFDEPASETIATEFVGTSISSGCGWRDDVEAALPENPHVKFFDGEYRGYVRCEITQDELRSDLRIVTSPGAAEGPAYTLASFVVANGIPGARQVEGSGDGITGRVTDAQTGEPAPNLSVEARNADGSVAGRTTIRVSERVSGDGARLGDGTGVVNGGPRLVDEGEPEITAFAEGFVYPEDPEFYYRFGERRNPRTLAGATRDGDLLLVAVDGRRPGYSVGASFEEGAGIMDSLGAEEAVNLDGGGSTGMTIGQRLVTRPSDTTGERPIGDAVVLLP